VGGDGGRPGALHGQYEIGASLSGKARAVNAAGHVPTGHFDVVIDSRPRQAYVNNAGQVVTTG
jgi:hypothetical protein